MFLPINTLRQNGLHLMTISILACKLGILNPTSQGCDAGSMRSGTDLTCCLAHSGCGVDTTRPLTPCSPHIYLTSVRCQALCLTNHTGDVSACPQQACGLGRKMKCINRQLLVGFEGSQEIAPLFLAELGTGRLGERPRWVLENVAWICECRAPTGPSVGLWVGVPRCRHWQPKEPQLPVGSRMCRRLVHRVGRGSVGGGLREGGGIPTPWNHETRERYQEKPPIKCILNLN